MTKAQADVQSKAPVTNLIAGYWEIMPLLVLSMANVKLWR